MNMFNYNKLRPETLQQIVGQRYIVEILTNMIEKNTMPSVLLFSGPKGTGKTSLARIVAKAINCSSKIKPCNNCLQCDIETDILEIDGATYNGVDSIKEIIEASYHLPIFLPKKVIIIDEIHMLSDAAFNSMLKTLESPPSHVLFIFLTTREDKILDTILSRSAILRTTNLSDDDLLCYLEKITEKKLNTELLNFVVEISEGSLRNCLVNLDMICNLNQKDIISVRKAFNICGPKEASEIYDDLLNGKLQQANEKLKEMNVAKMSFLRALLKVISQCAMKKMNLYSKKINLPYESISLNLIIRHWEIVVYQMNLLSRTNPDNVCEMTLIMLSTVIEEDVDNRLLSKMNNLFDPHDWVNSVVINQKEQQKKQNTETENIIDFD